MEYWNNGFEYFSMIHISDGARVIDDAYSYTKRFMYDSRLKLSNDVTHQRIEPNVAFPTKLSQFVF